MKPLPKKSLGQHFLRSTSALAKIIAASHVQADETVLEIGPGEGALTDELLKAGASVIAVEKDDGLFLLLEAKKSQSLKLIRGDILELNRGSLGLENGKYKIVANIPYYITGAILEMFLEHEPRPSSMTLLVQKEVAVRIVAHDKKESVLSISVKAFGEPRIIATVPAGTFVPPPSVDSAILNIGNISDSSFTEAGIIPAKFFNIVRAGFAHKRKFLMRNLEPVIERSVLEKIWQELNLDTKIRAEDVSVDQWIAIAQCTN